MDLKNRMKKLVVIVGLNGVRKSTTARELEIINCESVRLLNCGPSRFTVFFKQQVVGFVEIYENQFHNRNCYVKLELERYDRTRAKELFNLLQARVKRPLQVMLSSEEEEKITFLEKAGFRCKRKCYELCVTANDLCDTGNNIVFKEKVVHLENNDTFMRCKKDTEEYKKCARFMYEYYAQVHAAVNPLSASYEDFGMQLPEEVFYDSHEGEIRHIVFVEDNELAYVGSRDKSDFKRFVLGIVTKLFAKYEELSFECDDCDEIVMILKELFKVEVEESYNTYVRE